MTVDETTPSAGPEPGSAGAWGSRVGFIAACLGSAVGIGNIWRFPYVAGENGGAAFILVYLCAILLLGLPLLVAELAIGAAARADAVAAFRRLMPRRPWCWAGVPGVAACIAILAYYPVVAGWVASHAATVLATGLGEGDGASRAARFGALIAAPVPALAWPAGMLAAAGLIVAGGVQRGIERASLLLMPLFFVLLVALALHGLSLDGAGRGLSFMLRPEWAALARPRTYLAAIGQALFSLGIAMGILVTYGGYVAPGGKLLHAALAITLGDTVVSLIAGLIIFPAVFTYGVDPASGPTLAFVVLPQVFAAMPAGRWIAAAFFLLLLIAALTSLVSLLEVPVAIGLRSRQERVSVVLAVVALAYALCLPSALGFGEAGRLLPGNVPFLDIADHVASNLLLPFSAIVLSLAAGWAWSPEASRRAAGLGGMSAASWCLLLRIVVPSAIAAAMASGLGLL